MKMRSFGKTDLAVSRLALGTMRASLKEKDDMRALLETAAEVGINFVDHADVYAWRNSSEAMFGQVMAEAPALRDKFTVQTKCGIRPGHYDLSYEHIVKSAEESLRRLNVDAIDCFLLHRPDALMEPEEIARAFDKLHEEGKVRYFGVSNMNPGQIENLKRFVRQDIQVDQVQMSLVHAPAIDAGIFVNMKEEQGIMRDGSLLDYAQCRGMTVQAWSVVQIGLRDGTFLDHPDYPELNAVLERLAGQYGVTKAAVAVAWLLRHPAGIQPVLGTADPDHLRQLAKAADITLSRPEWYELYLSAGRKLP